MKTETIKYKLNELELKELFLKNVTSNNEFVIKRSNKETNKTSSTYTFSFYLLDNLKSTITLSFAYNKKEFTLEIENLNNNTTLSLQNKEIQGNEYLLALIADIKSHIYYLIDDLTYMETSFSNNASTFINLKNFAFKVPVLIEGDRGSGKTYDAFAFSKFLGIKPIFIGGHASIESIDLLGYLQPIEGSSKTLVFKDGPLTESIRRAQTKPTILIIDELLRIPSRQLNILLSTFSPINGMYYLRTSKMFESENGYVEEVLSCPTNNLFLIATTNTSSKYTVEPIDPALAERFIVISKNTTEEILRNILVMKLIEKDYNLAILDKLIKFYNAMHNGILQNLIEATPTVRTISRAIELSNNESDIPILLQIQANLWCSRDINGIVLIEELEFVNKAIKLCFE